MKLDDLLKLNKAVVYNNKIRTFLSIIIIFILSTLYMLLLYISLSYYTNSRNIEREYLKTNPISITIFINNNTDINDIYLKMGKVKPSYVCSNTSGITLVDFNNLIDFYIDIKSGKNPNSKSEVIVSLDSDYNIGDEITILNTKCKVVGKYESDFFEGIIGDLFSFYKNNNLESIIITYNEGEAYNNLNKINNIAKKLSSSYNSSINSSFSVVKQYHDNSLLVIIICLIIIFLFFLGTISFFMNSITMCYDQSKKLFNIIKVFGGKDSIAFVVLFIYTSMISLFGSILAGIFVLFVKKLIKIKEIFIYLLPTSMIEIFENSMVYNDSFPGLMIFLIITIVYIISICVYCKSIVYKEQKNLYSNFNK